MRRKTIWMGAAVCLLCLGVGPARATIVVGGPGDASTGNAFPFGANPFATFQQVYAASNFSSAITITGLTLYNNNFTPGVVSSADYNIQLSTTTAAVNALSNTFAANLGADNTTVFNSHYSGPANPSFTLNITPFHYDPTGGNLLLTIFKTNITTLGGSVLLDARNGTAGGLFSRKYSVTSTTTADNGGFDSNWGLVTGFETGATPAVPEPSSITMAITAAVLGLSLAARRRRRTAA